MRWRGTLMLDRRDQIRASLDRIVIRSAPVAARPAGRLRSGG